MADASVITISTPSGHGPLLVRGLQTREELGRLSEFAVSLLSERPDIDLDAILGANVTVHVTRPDGSLRHFNGYVTRISQGGRLGRYHRYHARVNPWLWFLTRTADCRIFQEMTVPAILRQVFGDHVTAAVDFQLTAPYRTCSYCVQYRETDFDFVSRLMEHEGISYHFRHEDGAHTMVLTDATASHTRAPGSERLPFVAPEPPAPPHLEHVSSWDVSREVQPGVYVHDDYDLERPGAALTTRQAVAGPYRPSDYEIYDYPGQYVRVADGQHYAAIRIGERTAQFEVAHASTTSLGVVVGALFDLDRFPRADQNREHLIVSCEYDLESRGHEGTPEDDGAPWRCRFSAMPSSQQFRPRRLTPRPHVQGPQTAVVVGPAGDEIFTDRFGRVKVQFHWDRRGRHDQRSSGWIRVSQAWAGTGWGAVATPRIGQEVIVDFLEGDPDQPIITGRVYNADQMPPYDLPANKTQSGVRSRSTTAGGPATFNEIRFEDRQGSEQVFIHAARDQDIDVENDETHRVGHNRRTTIGHAEVTHVGHDRTVTVDDNDTIAVGAAQSVDIGANQSTRVGRNLATTVGADELRKVAAGRSTDVGRDETVGVGRHYVLDAGDSITIRTGRTSITMTKDGTITITGKDITINATGGIDIRAAGDIVMKGSKILQN